MLKVKHLLSSLAQVVRCQVKSGLPCLCTPWEKVFLVSTNAWDESEAESGLLLSWPHPLLEGGRIVSRKVISCQLVLVKSHFYKLLLQAYLLCNILLLFYTHSRVMEIQERRHWYPEWKVSFRDFLFITYSGGKVVSSVYALRLE